MEEQKVIRKKRSFPLDDRVHHSYIFDILPDRIDGKSYVHIYLVGKNIWAFNKFISSFIHIAKRLL